MSWPLSWPSIDLGSANVYVLSMEWNGQHIGLHTPNKSIIYNLAHPKEEERYIKVPFLPISTSRRTPQHMDWDVVQIKLQVDNFILITD